MKGNRLYLGFGNLPSQFLCLRPVIGGDLGNFACAMPFLRLLFQRYQRVYPLPADFLFQPACGFGDVFGKPIIVAVVAQCGGVVGVVADGEVAAAEMVAALQTRAFCRIPFAAAFAAVARAGADVVGKRGIGFVVGEGFNSFPARIGQGFFLLADMGAGFVQQVVQRGLPVFFGIALPRLQAGEQDLGVGPFFGGDDGHGVSFATKRQPAL